MLRGECPIDFREAGIPDQCRAETSGHIVQFLRGSEDEVAIARFVVVGRRHESARAVLKAHDSGNVKNMLVEAREEKSAVLLDRPADGSAELVLLVGGLEVKETRLGVQAVVTHKPEGAAMNEVAAGFSRHVN